MKPYADGMESLDASIGRAATATRIGETVQSRQDRTDVVNHVRAMRDAEAAARQSPSKANVQRARTAGDRARQRVAGNRRWTPPKGRR